MKPFSYFRRCKTLSVTFAVSRGNAEVTPGNKPESLTSGDCAESLPLLPVLPSKKQSSHFTEAIPGTENAVMNKVRNDELLTGKVTGKGNTSKATTDAHLSDSLSVTSANLEWWIEQLKQCMRREEVFDLLRKFQPLDWTDQTRAQMSHAYNNQLEVLKMVAA